MNALAKKEIRMLLPALLVSLVLAFANWLAVHEYGSATGVRTGLSWAILALCPVTVVMLALVPFGGEVSAGTFSNLLTQPVPRSRVWFTKTSIGAASLAVVLGVWWFTYFDQAHYQIVEGDRRLFLTTTLLLVLSVYSGALWTVLLFRQVVLAFWCTVLTPGALLVSIVFMMEQQPDRIGYVLTGAFGIYSVAGFLWARWMFLRAQDVPWTGGNVSLPKWRPWLSCKPVLVSLLNASDSLPTLRVWSRVLDRKRSERRWRPWSACFVKEFQLHQSQLVVAAVLVLVHLAVIGTRKFWGELKETNTMEFMFLHFWLVWFAMPLLVGSAAVAEERNLGTMPAELCLPARRFTLFSIKLAVVLALSVLLGLGMPLLLEGSRILPEGRRILPVLDLPIPSNLADPYVQMPAGRVLAAVWNVFQWIVTSTHSWHPFLAMAGITASLGVISFYASSLARTTLQALAPAIAGFLISGVMLIGASDAESVFHYPLWRGSLIYLIGLPVLAMTFARLLYENFKHPVVNWSLWRRNVFAGVAALVFVMAGTASIYHRSWELLTTLEKPHGPARLSRSLPVTIQGEGAGTIIQLSDGRVWSPMLSHPSPTWATLISGDWEFSQELGGGRFLEGTNWVSVARVWRDTVGIQRDGSLWVSEHLDPNWGSPLRVKASKPEPVKMVRFGTGNDWKSLANFQLSSYMLKTNGSLWRWGTNRIDSKVPWPGLRSLEPLTPGRHEQNLPPGTRIVSMRGSTGWDAGPAVSDWAEIFVNGPRTYLRKVDGKVWAFSGLPSPSGTIMILDKDTVLERTPYLDQTYWRGLAWAISTRGSGFQVGVTLDGRFKVNAAWEFSRRFQAKSWVLAEQNIRLGKDSDWVGVAGDRNGIVTLKADGSLWKWSFPEDPLVNASTATASRLGTHSDWVGIAGTTGGVFSLATDGGLYYWLFDRSSFAAGFEPPFQPLLALSKKSQLVANLFGK